MSEQKLTILTTIASFLSSRDSFRKLLHVSIMEDGHLFNTLRPFVERTHLRLSTHIIYVSKSNHCVEEFRQQGLTSTKEIMHILNKQIQSGTGNLVSESPIREESMIA